ncbi:MAG: sulfotransferase [Candidatus Omnitrophica bacterium]|nr:sulfotransferase [Candidatus Omnitrophota bacterium]
MTSKQMFFIVGRGRSGTSLLQTILNQHPHIAVAPEAQFVMLLYRKYRRRKFDEKVILNFYQDLFLEARLKNWKIDKTLLKKELLAIDKPDFSKLTHCVYAHYGHQRGKIKPLILGDKNPHYALFVKDLIQIFPKAKFIHLIRDARDNVLSYRNVSFDMKSTTALAYRWNFYHKEILKVSEQYNAQFTRLYFEQLIESPEKELRRICRFLGVGYNPGMLQFYQSVEWDTPWRRNLYKPLDRNLPQNWRQKMSQEDIGAVECVCGKLLSKFSYSVSLSNVTPIKYYFIKIFGFFCAGIYTCLEKVIYYFPIRFVAWFLIGYRKLTGTWITEEKSTAGVHA